MNNCPNCGAPLTGFKCKYCGAVFYDFASLSFDTPIFMRIKLPNGNVITAKTIMTRGDLEIKDNETRLYCDNEVVCTLSGPEMEIHTEYMLRGDKTEVLDCGHKEKNRR